MNSNRNCPIPECRKPMGANAFFCPKHAKLLPPVIAAAIKKSHLEWKRLERGTPERAIIAGTLKQALSFGFASVCDQLGLQMPGVTLERDARQPESRVLSHAIKKALH